MNREMMQRSSAAALGRAIDGAPERRPGVPMELDPPRAAGGAHWDRPERTPAPAVPVLKRSDLDELTPVFSSATPPHGISGLMRRAAFRSPEHHTMHWLLLLLADRVDAVESDPRTLVTLAALGVGGVVALAASKRRRRPRWARWFR